MSFATSIIAALCMFGVIALTLWSGGTVGGYFGRRTRRHWVGLIIGVLVAALIFYASMPVIRALTVVGCQSDEHPQMCIDGD